MSRILLLVDAVITRLLEELKIAAQHAVDCANKAEELRVAFETDCERMSRVLSAQRLAELKTTIRDPLQLQDCKITKCTPKGICVQSCWSGETLQLRADYFYDWEYWTEGRTQWLSLRRALKQLNAATANCEARSAVLDRLRLLARQLDSCADLLPEMADDQITSLVTRMAHVPAEEWAK